MIIYECEQYSQEYWDLRRGVPTASELDNIITTTGKPSAQAEGYACRLVGDIYDAFYGQTSDYLSSPMREGHFSEPEARAFYEFHRDRDVRQVGFCTTDDGRFGCSPDALADPDGVVELKCPQSATQIQYVVDNCLPPKYRAQAHGHLIVTGREWCDFMSYRAGFPRVLVRVVPDDFTKRLRDELEKFWVLYQDIKARVEERRQETITAEIARKGAQLDEKKDAGLRTFLPGQVA